VFGLTVVHFSRYHRAVTSTRPPRDAALHADAARPSRREQILQTAAQLFAERGSRAVGVDDIGAAVGVTGPAIYRHFASKDAMLAEMLLLISERLLAGGSEVVAHAGDDVHEQLRALIAFQVDFALDNPALITVQDRDLSTLAEADAAQVRRLQRRYVEVWVTVLAELHPTADPATCRARAHAIFGLINSTPHSAGRLGRPSMAGLLSGMARAAASA
jgi:AcrR family transcriptional regulator